MLITLGHFMTSIMNIGKILERFDKMMAFILLALLMCITFVKHSGISAEMKCCINRNLLLQNYIKMKRTNIRYDSPANMRTIRNTRVCVIRDRPFDIQGRGGGLGIYVSIICF